MFREASKEREDMATRITRLFLSATVGLVTLAFLPSAWAGGRMGMMAGRSMMTPNMMAPTMMNSNMMMGRMNMGNMTTGNMNGNMMNGNMMNGNMMTTPFNTGFGFGNPNTLGM